MRRALAALAATVIGVYWVVTFKVSAEPIEVPVVSVPSPRVRKPNPRSRLNHFTTARSSPEVGVTCTCVRAGGSCVG